MQGTPSDRVETNGDNRAFPSPQRYACVRVEPASTLRIVSGKTGRILRCRRVIRSIT